MKKILIATDGSPSATHAVEIGLELADEHSAEPSIRRSSSPRSAGWRHGRSS